MFGQPAPPVIDFRLAHHEPAPGAVIVPQKVVDRLAARVARRHPDLCWPYLPTRPFTSIVPFFPNPKRYFGLRWQDEAGEFWSVRAHRLALIVARGPIAPGLMACHRCHNSHCCNPWHLYAGTGKQNAADRWRLERNRGIVVTVRQPAAGFACA